MMVSKLRLLTLACMAAAAPWSAQAAVVLIDFESISLANSIGTPVASTFSGKGLTFSPFALAYHNGVPGDLDNQRPPPVRAGSRVFVLNEFTTHGESFFVDIATGFNYGGFSLKYAAGNPFTVNALDSGGGLLGTLSDISSRNTWSTQLSVLSGGSRINRINFVTSGSLAIDDLQFTEIGTGGATVPEPAGFGLVGLALFAAGLAARRRKPA